jgi:hypothetical protein
MKKIYVLLTAFVFSMNTNAQLSLTKTANAPVVGTIQSDKSFDSTTVVPKTTGTNKSWNFTSLTPTAGIDSYTFVSSSSTPSASSFPGATLATSDGAGYYNYYNSQTSALDWAGNADVSSSDKVVLSNPMTEMIWPFTYGTTNNDSFSGTETFSTTSFGVSGNMNISGTGTGTVTLPGGSKYNNCLQITRTYTYILAAPVNFTVTGIDYEYWVSTFKGPIMSISYTKLNDGSSITPDFSASSNIVADVGIKELEKSEEMVVVYPNPVKEKLNVVLKDNAIADKMELFDATGKRVLIDANTNSLNTFGLQKGVYLLQVNVKDSRFVKQVIVTE